jgi:predicted O-linked N-acetylglucosamine transferase (SPINDLY family)
MSRWRRVMPDVADRVVWLDRMDRDAFLAVTSLCDVMLDPTHFCGGNTSYEAFAFGVPVVTLPSPLLRGRLTYAMYRKMGLDACVATSIADYIERAVGVATDRDRREAVRRDLRDRAAVLYENRSAVTDFGVFLRAAAAGQL